jgi:hypothetical protein
MHRMQPWHGMAATGSERLQHDAGPLGDLTDRRIRERLRCTLNLDCDRCLPAPAFQVADAVRGDGHRGSVDGQ